MYRAVRRRSPNPQWSMEDFSPHDRFRFPDEPEGVELRAFTHGLQPATVPAMLERFAEDWRRFGVDAWNEVPNHWRPDSNETVGWWTLPTYLGDQFVAPLLGAPHGTCILQPNVHWSVQCLLSAPELRDRGRHVVVPETAFPSLLHSVQQWADGKSIVPRVTPATASHRPDRDAVLDAIDETTALVALSHVGFTSGARLPDAFLQHVAETAHAHGALLLLDGYHAVGTMPVDVVELGCDLYAGGLLKAGSGAAGNAFLYVRENLELTPRLTGWFGDAAPFDFRPDPTPHPDVRRRFLGGTTAVAPMYHAVEGVRILLELGLDAVRSHSVQLTNVAIERAESANLTVRSPREPQERGAMLVVEAPDAHKLSLYLKERSIYTDSRRNDVLRMAPFVWNAREDVHRTFDQIEDALETGAHQDLSAAPAGPVH